METTYRLSAHGREEDEMRLEKKIAQIARETLGRTAGVRSLRGWGRVMDRDAWDAVQVAARELGLVGTLSGYQTATARSLTAMAAAYISRYVQAYGPVDLGDGTVVIDAGAHAGTRRCVIVV